MDAAGARQRCAEPPHPELIHGIEEFNRREFFECHETLEALWLHEADTIRYLYQGILQVGVGYLHLLRANHHGSLTKLVSGVMLLEYFEPACQGVDVQSLVQAARKLIEKLETLGPDGIASIDREDIPLIQMHADTP
jgi:predicted metal-dependent hydrolase